VPNGRSKGWGYEVEKAFERILRDCFPRLRRVGSPGYYRAAPDLVQDGLKDPDKGLDYTKAPIRIVATKDKGRDKPYLVTLSAPDLYRLTAGGPWRNWFDVRVQVKGRKETWIGRLYQELVEATK